MNDDDGISAKATSVMYLLLFLKNCQCRKRHSLLGILTYCIVLKVGKKISFACIEHILTTETQIDLRFPHHWTNDAKYFPGVQEIEKNLKKHACHLNFVSSF